MKLGKHKPLVLGIGAVATVGMLALVQTGLGYSAFSSTQTKTTAVNAGTLTLTLGNSSGASFSQAVTAMAPGDYIQRQVVLTNTGTVGVSVVSISATPSTCTVDGTATSCSSTPLLAGDTTSPPMQVFAYDCPSGTVTASEIDSSGEYNYTCSASWSTALGAPLLTGGTLTVPTTGSVGYESYSGSPATGSITSATPLTLPTTTNAQGVSEVIPPGGSVDLVLTSYLPSTADNAFQDNSATIDYTFTVTQRAGEAK